MGARRLVTLVAYVVGRGLRGMRQSVGVQLVAIGTMAVSMVLLGATTLIWKNARDLLCHSGIDVPITVYMVDEVEPARAEALTELLRAMPEVAAVERIAPEQALDRLREGLGDGPSVLDGVEAEALPQSLEVYVRSEAPPEFGVSLASRLEALPHVDEVAVLGSWAVRIRDLVATARLLAVGVGLLVCGACMAIVWNTIRLGVYARRAEIQILRLVGGTTRFVSGPFVFEGLVQGMLAAVLALAVLYVGFDLARPLVEHGFASVLAAGAVGFFAPIELVVSIAFGGLLGTFGSQLAVARYIEP
jgi:cell division transport system permease protein